MGTSLLEEAFKGYQNISEQCVEQTRLKLWFSFLKRIPDKLIYYKALDITEGKWKKKKRQVFSICMWLCALNYLSLRGKREKKTRQIRILGHCAPSQALRTEFTKWFCFPRFFKVSDSSCGQTL